jgi:hypothetical protein
MAADAEERFMSASNYTIERRVSERKSRAFIGTGSYGALNTPTVKRTRWFVVLDGADVDFGFFRKQDAADRIKELRGEA